MKKNILCFVSLMLLSSVAYSSAIVSQMDSSSKSSIVNSSNSGHSSIVTDSINTRSSIYNPKNTIHRKTAGKKTIQKDIFRQYEDNTRNVRIANEALKVCVQNSNYKYATDILMNFVRNYKRISSLLTQQDYEYLKSFENDLLANLNNSKNKSDFYALLAPLAIIVDNDKQQAMNYAKNAYDSNPDKYRTLLAQIDILFGNIHEANDLINTQLKKAPFDNDALFILTRYLLTDNKKSDKTRILNNCKTLIKYPKYKQDIAPIMFDLLVYKNASDEEIIRSFFPSEPNLSIEDGYIKLINLFLNYWDKNYADKVFAKAENSVSNKSYFYLALAEYTLKNGKKDAAKSYLEKAKTLISTNDEISKYNIMYAIANGQGSVKGAETLAASGRYDDAIKIYESGDPNSLEALLGVAKTYAASGNNTAALNSLNKAMSLYPDNALVYYSFALYFSNTGDIETARKYISNALKIDPRNPQIVELSNKLKGKKLDDLLEDAFNAFDAQNYNETIAILNKITKVDPDNYTAYYYKGLTYGNMNDFNSAINEFLRAKSLNPNFVLVNYLLGVAYENLGDKQEAKKYYSIYLNKETNVTNENAEYINYARSRIEKL